MNHRFLFVLSLAAIYLVWGSAYLVTHIAMQAFPPLLLSGLRNLLAGCVLFLFLWWRGVAMPDRQQCRSAVMVGSLLGASNGMISIGMTSVHTGIAAVMVATVPLFSSLITLASGIRVRRLEWLAIIIGLGGIALLNRQDGMQALNAGNAAILAGALSWALGSHLSVRLPSHQNVLMATALQIMLGGAIVLAGAWLSGARLEADIGIEPWLAFLYLCAGASLLTSCAYMYLIRHSSPAIAVSYAYVNPVVALLLGMLVLGETVSLQTVLAMLVILTSVALVFWSNYRPN